MVPAMDLARILSLAALWVGIVLLAIGLQAEGADPLPIQIRVLNARNGEPVADQKVSVAVKGMKDATEYVTDAKGNVRVYLPAEAEVFAATEWWTTCREMRAGVDPYVSVGRVFEEGVTVANSCGRAKSEAVRGRLIIFAKKSSLLQLFQK